MVVVVVVWGSDGAYKLTLNRLPANNVIKPYLEVFVLSPRAGQRLCVLPEQVEDVLVVRNGRRLLSARGLRREAPLGKVLRGVGVEAGVVDLGGAVDRVNGLRKAMFTLRDLDVWMFVHLQRLLFQGGCDDQTILVGASLGSVNGPTLKNMPFMVA